jgi:hypothetical protein
MRPARQAVKDLDRADQKTGGRDRPRRRRRARGAQRLKAEFLREGMEKC